MAAVPLSPTRASPCAFRLETGEHPAVPACRRWRPLWPTPGRPARRARRCRPRGGPAGGRDDEGCEARTWKGASPGAMRPRRPSRLEFIVRDRPGANHWTFVLGLPLRDTAVEGTGLVEH